MKVYCNFNVERDERELKNGICLNNTNISRRTGPRPALLVLVRSAFFEQLLWSFSSERLLPSLSRHSFFLTEGLSFSLPFADQHIADIGCHLIQFVHRIESSNVFTAYIISLFKSPRVDGVIYMLVLEKCI